MEHRVDKGAFRFTDFFQQKIKFQRSAPQSHEKPETKDSADGGQPYLLFVSGAMTAEAAFVATIFFLATFALFYLFTLLLDVNKMQTALSDCAQEYACTGTKIGTVEGIAKENVVVLWDEQEGICYTTVTEGIPFLGSRFFQMHLYQQIKISNYSGRSMVPEGEVTQDEQIVYITENGTVYHCDRDCTYLNPKISEIRYGDADEKRNSSGAKYYPCEKCFTGEPADTDIVYITAYGNRVHLDRQCSGLKRTVREVPLSEVGDMKGCSKCSSG